MGLTIHYKGSFKSDASLPAMIEEVKDIAEIFNWKYTIFETEFPAIHTSLETFDKKIYGINFIPAGCETISFCFLSNRKMSCAINLRFYGNLQSKNDAEYLYMLFAKTQFAGYEMHELIIHLFKYMEKKYFYNFHVKDEGEYWETGDEEKLKENFNRYTQLLNIVSFSLENIPKKKGESIEEYFKRILQSINAK